MMSVYVRTGVGGIVHLLIVENSDRTGKPAAALLRDVIVAGGTKGASICFATGSSPLPAYQELVAMHKSEAFPVEATRAKASAASGLDAMKTLPFPNSISSGRAFSWLAAIAAIRSRRRSAARRTAPAEAAAKRLE